LIHLTDYIEKEMIIILDSTSKKEIIPLLAEQCLQSYDEEIREEIIEDLLTKTPGKNINIGKGFGITHTRTDKVDDIKVAVGIFKDEVKLFDKEPIHTLFCVIIPHQKSRIYLSFIAHLSRVLSSPKAVETFKEGAPNDIFNFIQKAEL